MSEVATTSQTSIDPRVFRDVLGHYPTGVALITATLPGEDGPEHVGMVVGTFSSVSIDPPLVAFMPDKNSRTFARLQEAEHLCVNVLAADQSDVVSSWRGSESFDSVGWSYSPAGAPLLDDSVSWIDCTQRETVDAGDHWIVLGAVTDLGVQRASSPLLFFQGGFGGFASPSFLVPMDQELIRAARLSEVAMGPLSTYAVRERADVSLLAKIGDHDIVIGTERGSDSPSYAEVGLRLPHCPPAGAVYLEAGDDISLEQWLGRLPRRDEDVRARCVELSEKVLEQGYSLSLMGRGPAAEQWEDVTRYIHGEPTPQRERQVLNMHLEHLDYYEPDVVAGHMYDVRSITVAVPRLTNPRLAVRVTAPPAHASGERVLQWCRDAVETAIAVGDLVDARFGHEHRLD